MEGLGCMSSNGATEHNSLLATKPLLRKTGGRDILSHNSIENLYANQGNNSMEYLDFNNDYHLTEEDNEAINFITHSYEYAVVVDIADILLTVKFLQPNVQDGWLFDSVIDAYAYIANVENALTSVVSTFQSQELTGHHGDFDPKKDSQWIGRIGQRRASCPMVFVPFNVWGCHWCLLVVNKERKEIQILNSLASIPQFRNESMETTLVDNIQACIERAVEVGYLLSADFINITQWSKNYYTDIPQQKDSNSCGIYVLKYMLEWNGVQMRNTFTQDQMNIFRRKICCRLMRSECNKSRRPSYKEPLTKQKYLSQHPQNHKDPQALVLSEDENMSAQDDAMQVNNMFTTEKPQGKYSGGQRCGRPRKVEHTVKAAAKQVIQKSVNTSVVHLRGENQRVSTPSQYMLSPYK